MATIAIDTLATMRKLEKAGFETVQAEAVAEVVGRQGDDLATKADLKLVQSDLKVVKSALKVVQSDLKVVQSDLKVVQSDLKVVQSDLKAVEKSLRQDITGVRGEVAGLRWTFGIVAGFVVALNLVIFGFMYQGNQQINQQITHLTQQVGHLSGVVEQWPRQ